MLKSNSQTQMQILIEHRAVPVFLAVVEYEVPLLFVSCTVLPFELRPRIHKLSSQPSIFKFSKLAY